MLTGPTTNGPTEGHPTLAEHLCPTGPPDAVLNLASAEAVVSVFNRDPTGTDSKVEAKPDSWRVEVAARLERYRARRKPRSPRYPSLLLPFDAPQSWSHLSPTGSEGFGSAAIAVAQPPTGLDLTVEVNAKLRPINSERAPYRHTEQSQAPDSSAKVIEFPRYAAIPVFTRSQLADPIFDRPRIVEAPEVLPPPPALGGMLIEPAPEQPVDRRTTADYPVASASISRRALAALVDGAILTTALAGFSAIFLRLNPNMNPSLNPLRGSLPQLASAFGLVAVLLWMTYEFIFVVYTGTTPGLRAARLRLAHFDGSVINRRRRRWRVLVSFLSAFSAGLGYLWCLLDEDGLCWHDRITRTHVQPSSN